MKVKSIEISEYVSAHQHGPGYHTYSVDTSMRDVIFELEDGRKFVFKGNFRLIEEDHITIIQAAKKGEISWM